MKSGAIVRILVAAFSFLTLTISSVSGQVDQTIFSQYCIARPDTTCFQPQNGTIDSVGRDVAALGGAFRFCLEVDTVDSGFGPIRVILVLDNSQSMCQQYGPGNCCVDGDGSGDCSMNDPTNKRVEAANMFVDNLRSLNPESEVGVIIYSGSVSTTLQPTPLTSDANVTSIHSVIANASCGTSSGKGGSLAKTTTTKETNLGNALQAALVNIDNNYAAMPTYMTRHIILLTDGAWDDVTSKSPTTLINAYKTQYTDGRAVPKVHGVFISDSLTHVTHGYPAEGCSQTGQVELGNLQTAANLTGGLFFGGTTPQTVVNNFKVLLDSVMQTGVQRLDSLIVTNTTNGETRINGTIRQIGSSATWEATIQNLPLVSGPNVLTVRRVIKKASGTKVDSTTTVTIIRSDLYREALDTDLFKVYCDLVQATIRITATPESQMMNKPFDVQATITSASGFKLDTVKVRVFTGFPDNDQNVLATFHLDGDLTNASGSAAGVGSPAFTTADYLFGSAAISAGSFTCALPQLTDAFVIEAWVKPGNNAAAVLFSGGGIEIGITAGMKLYLKNDAGFIDTAVMPLDDGVWSHIAVARSNGKVTLFINGIAAANPVDFTLGIPGSVITVSSPAKWVVDEVRFSSSVANRITGDGGTTMLVIPTVLNTLWNVGKVPSASAVLNVGPSAWKIGTGDTLNLTFASPVAGRVLVNIRQREFGGVGTGWSKNSNPVLIVSDVEAPFIKQAILTPSPVEGTAGRDSLRIIFSEGVNCKTLKQQSDPSRTFVISRDTTPGNTADKAVDRPDLLKGSSYAVLECGSEFITEVILLVSGGINPQYDSIRIISAAVVDSAGNASPVAGGKKGDIVWGAGVITSMVPIKSEEGQDPMQISSTVQNILGVTVPTGKIIAIRTQRPLDALIENGNPVVDKKDNKPAYGLATIYDAVGNLVNRDLYIKLSDVPQVYYVIWDGTNLNKRRVGQSTYLAQFNFSINNSRAKDRKKFALRWH